MKHLHKATWIFAVLILISFQNTKAQNGLIYGIGSLSNGVQAFNGIQETDPANGHLIDHSIMNAVYHAFGDHCSDGSDTLYFQVIGDSINMYLLKIGFNTGQVMGSLFTVDSVGNGASGSVTIGGNINGTFYDCEKGDLLFFHYKAPFEDSVHFAKVDPLTGSVTELAKFPIFYTAIDNFVDDTHHDVFMTWYDYIGGHNYLIDYNLSSGNTTQVMLSDDSIAYDNIDLTLNPVDNMLYGLRVNFDNFSANNYLESIWIIKVNPVSGLVTYLTDTIIANVIGSNILADGAHAKLYFLAQQTNPGFPVLFEYDINAGTYYFQAITDVSTSYPYGSPYGIDLYDDSKSCGHITTFINPPAETDCGFSVSSFDAGTIHVHNPCDVSAYANLHLQLFDVLGRLITDAALHGNDVDVKVGDVASSVCLFRLMDGNLIIEKGKVGMVR